jgi:Porin subfamily
MKMVKSLLLGSAAGLVAVTAGQAADLPVKAKPVEYVKVCSLYGAGFYYMPGTDMCIKIGGWTRTEFVYGQVNGSLTWGPFAGNSNNATSTSEAFRARGYITADAREQTAYGTARAYIDVGINTNDAGLQVANLALSSNRAFLQWAGITAGLTQSFYDFYSVPAASYRGGYYPASDTGDPGWFVWGYTAQLGNGLTATISTEARRITQIINQSSASAAQVGIAGLGSVTPGTYTSAIAGGGAEFPGAGAYGGMQAGDFVGNIRLDQTWGSAQVMAAAHELNTAYYSSNTGGTADATPGAGRPSDQWGYAVGAGLRLNFPMIAQGDYFQSQVNYTQGALRYLFFTPNTNWGKVDGASETFGVMSDCVYGGQGQASAPATLTTNCQLTTAWGVNASYEHYWTPAVHESVFGAYYAVNYNQGTGSANSMLCVMEGNGTGVGSSAVAGAGCNNNWSMYAIGSRLQWDVTKSFYLGIEGIYDHMNSATLNATGTVAAPLAIGSANTIEAHSNAWTVSVRMHKDFLP